VCGRLLFRPVAYKILRVARKTAKSRQLGEGWKGRADSTRDNHSLVETERDTTVRAFGGGREKPRLVFGEKKRCNGKHMTRMGDEPIASYRSTTLPEYHAEGRKKRGRSCGDVSLMHSARPGTRREGGPEEEVQVITAASVGRRTAQDGCPSPTAMLIPGLSGKKCRPSRTREARSFV